MESSCFYVYHYSKIYSKNQIVFPIFLKLSFIIKITKGSEAPGCALGYVSLGQRV